MKLPWFMRARRAVLVVTGLGGLSTLVNVGFAQPWASNSPRLLWGSVATSADGGTIVAAANWTYYNSLPAPIYVSTNAGASWVQTTAPTNGWSSVACSADGLRLVAASMISDYTGARGLIYTSPRTCLTMQRGKQ